MPRLYRPASAAAPSSLPRRSLLKLAGAGLLAPGLMAPGKIPRVGERKFLFVFCDGGWDVLKVFAPLFDSKTAVMDADAEPVDIHGLPLVASPSRVAVSDFFELYGDRCCLVQGMEVRSVAHERCRRILMTGAGEGGADDWGSILAGSSLSQHTLPYLVMAGYAFTARYSAQVVRVGANNQLPDLLRGEALPRGVQPASPEVAALAEGWLQGRLAGADQGVHGAYRDALDALRALEDAGRAGTLSLQTSDDGCQFDVAADASVVLDCMAQGLTRCGMVMSQGWCNIRWDQHTRLEMQDQHYSHLFTYLSEIMAGLDARTALSGAPLSEEVTVVVFSEMGRHPIVNGVGGRDHWTYTSALLIGSGVRGGHVVGGYDDVLLGRGVDLATGEPYDGGTAIVPGHLGATLLALGDVDPGEHLPGYAPILGVLA